MIMFIELTGINDDKFQINVNRVDYIYQSSDKKGTEVAMGGERTYIRVKESLQEINDIIEELLYYNS